ncbi:MAG TPA: MFS transporter [Bryobacteraceae bacterium]|nr:MFS transporter [Bryobacteraceae bacterium]
MSFRGGAGLLTLLVLSVTINYIDRGALSVAAPIISKELDLTTAQMGLLLSAFFWTYATSQLIVGPLVDRYPVKWVYAIGYLVWSLATAAVGMLYSLPALLAARFVLGLGESVAYPACSKVIVQTFPEGRRGLANAMVDAGSKVGPGLSTLLGGLAVAAWGWRGVFIGIGFGSLFWLIPWLMSAPSEDTDTGTAVAAPGWSEMLSNRQVWVSSLGMFTYGYTNYFLLTWLPSYLIKERGFSMEDMATLGSIPFWTMAAASLAAGAASDALIRGGRSASGVRKAFAASGLALCGVGMLTAPMVPSATHSLLLITFASAAIGLYSSNVWAITQTLAGRPAAGRWTGFQNFFGNLGGVIAPLATGMIVSQTGSFLLAFWTAAAILALGVSAYTIFLQRIEPVTWKTT